MTRSRIPKAGTQNESRVVPGNIAEGDKVARKCVVFSFELLDENEFFRLDGTCPNWSKDLFDVLKEVSAHTMKELTSGSFTGSSPLRVHRHQNAHPPCEVPHNIDLNDMWQIRISASKGGIHGLFIDNAFYVVWLDPQHNLYPDKRYGGLKVIKPPSTCCKERDKDLMRLCEENNKLRQENDCLMKELDIRTTPDTL